MYIEENVLLSINNNQYQLPEKFYQTKAAPLSINTLGKKKRKWVIIIPQNITIDIFYKFIEIDRNKDIRPGN